MEYDEYRELVRLISIVICPEYIHIDKEIPPLIARTAFSLTTSRLYTNSNVKSLHIRDEADWKNTTGNYKYEEIIEHISGTWLEQQMNLWHIPSCFPWKDDTMEWQKAVTQPQLHHITIEEFICKV